MMVIIKKGYSQDEFQAVMKRLEEVGLSGHPIIGQEKTVIGVVGQVYPELADDLETMPGVDGTVPISASYKLSSREFKADDTIVNVRGVPIGDDNTVIIAGPCAVESEDQVLAVARAVKAAGAQLLRGGAFKPRTSPYSFRGLEKKGLELLAAAREETGLPVVTEVMSVRDIDLIAEWADMLQIGARNAQNFILLEEVGKAGKPVLLKRGLSSTIQEFLLAAEYVLKTGNRDVIMCERGIRTFETATRNTLDVNAIALIREVSHLPVIADPSHGTGKWALVQPVGLACIAAGAHGLIVEVHPNPDHALSDGAQSLTPEKFAELMAKATEIANVMGRPMYSAATAVPA